MSENRLAHQWSEWRVVCSESHLLSALKRGYFIPSSIDAHGHFGADQQGLILVRGGEVPRRSDEVRDPTGELGQPVSVRWKDNYLKLVVPELTAQTTDRIEVAKGLALYRGGIQVEFSEYGRRAGLLAFLEDPSLASALLPGEFIDPQITAAKGRASKRGKREKVRQETVELFEDPSLHEWSSMRTRKDADRLEVAPQIIAEFESEERLQCATELVLEVAEKQFQFDFAAALARAKQENWVDHGEALGALCEYRATRGGTKRHPIANFAAHIHELDQERRNSPMIDADKLVLLRKAIKSKWVVSSQDLEHLTEMLELVEADDSLSSLNLSEMSSWMQGVVLFLLHSASPQDVLGISRSYFRVSLEAVSIAAFLVGLRFARDSYKSDRVFMPLRDLHVRRAVEILNDCVDHDNDPLITSQSGSIEVGGERFTPARPMLVFEFEKCPVFVEDAKSGSMRIQAERIVIPRSADTPKVSFEEIEDWASHVKDRPDEILHILTMGSVLRTTKKKNKIRKALEFVESFSDYERIFANHQAVALKFRCNVLIDDSNKVRRDFANPKVLIKLDRVVSILNLPRVGAENEFEKSEKRALQKKIREQLPKHFRERRERVEISE